MADEKPDTPDIPRDLSEFGPPLKVLAQYVKDVSFENPNAPDALKGGEAPEMDVNIGMDARKLEDSKESRSYEVVLNLRAEAKRGGETVFIAELQYGVTAEVGEDVPENNHHPLLLIEVPKLAFPFARKILSDLTVEGGYPPLLLTPVDFHGLYVNQFVKQAEQELEEAGAEAN